MKQLTNTLQSSGLVVDIDEKDDDEFYVDLVRVKNRMGVKQMAKVIAIINQKVE